jgi:O-antigen ligase
MALKFSKFFIILFILTSFITQSLSESGILYRITPPDIAGALGLFFFVLSGRSFNFSYNQPMILFIITLFIGGLVGLNLSQSIIEVVILLFLLLIFLVLVDLFGSVNGFCELIYYFSLAGILASGLGIYDYFSYIIGLPRIFPERAEGEVLSGFRNAGQAGSYAMIILAILIPAITSKVYTVFNNKQKRTLVISLVMVSLFLFLTGKMAAYIGFGIGFLLSLLMRRNYKTFLISLVVGLVLLIVVKELPIIAPDVHTRIVGKYETRLAGTLEGESGLTDEEGFFRDNISKSIAAFSDNPITGTGIGAFGGSHYGRHEVHSTYFKMIGETGIIGTIAYIIFMIFFMKKLRYKKHKDVFSEFLYFVLPFIIGCLVSWAYTYHMRKREFWIMFAIIFIADFFAKSVQINNRIKTGLKQNQSQ